MCQIINKVKWLIILCFMFLLVFWKGMNANAEAAVNDTSIFEYEENVDGTINITDCNEQEETLIIPSEIDGKRVKAIKLNYINDRRESECQIKRLVISEGINDIMRNAFYNCKSLEQVFFPSTLKMIGNYAFEYCNNLREINFSEGLVSIGEHAFDSCYNLKNITLPNSLISIGKGAFAQCRSLSKIIIPGNLKVIQRSTFFNCISLQEVEI